MTHPLLVRQLIAGKMMIHIALVFLFQILYDSICCAFWTAHCLLTYIVTIHNVSFL
jgi:hypothetical protein